MKHVLLLTALLAVVGPTAAQAQIKISGRVIDNSTLEGIEDVEVRISEAELDWRVIDRVFTDSSGAFAFTVARASGFIFRARRLGYENTETPILWTDGYNRYAIEIRLDPNAVLLAPIEVLARGEGQGSPVLANFRHRLEAGLGHYFTRGDIERLKPHRVTDLLAQVPGVRLEGSGAGLRRAVYMSRGVRGDSHCPAQIFVDGMQWSRPRALGSSDFSVDDFVTPGDVVAIEVYRGLATIPAEFLTSEAKCGVVAIWTRR